MKVMNHFAIRAILAATRQYPVILILALTGTGHHAYSQKGGKYTALGLPGRLTSVQIFESEQKYKEFLKNLHSDPRHQKDKPWVVFSDRENNELFDKPGGSKNGRKLFFGESCIVIDQTDEWIKVVPGDIDYGKKLSLSGDNVEEKGWIKKEDMILWQNALLNNRTNVYQKVFLLNKADTKGAIESIIEDKHKVPVYNSPTSRTQIESSPIYRHFFVYKESPDRQRYLVGKEYRANPSLNQPEKRCNLYGWIEKWRIEEWNTRLALEPNYSAEAFAERKADVNLRLIGFLEQEAAKSHGARGRPIDSKIGWDNDPVKDAALLGKGDQHNPVGRYRYNGYVMRFPMLSSAQGKVSDDRNVIRTGIVGDMQVRDTKGQSTGGNISQQQIATFREEYNKMLSASNALNVVFLIEGTEKMGTYRPFLESIYTMTNDAVKGTPKVGMVVYRDCNEREQGKDIEVLKLIRDENAIRQFIARIEFTSWKDEDEYTNLHQAIHTAVTGFGFNPNQPNLIIVLGKGPDVSYSKGRKRGLKSSNDPAYFENLDIAGELREINASIFFIHCVNDYDHEVSNEFVSTTKGLALELAKLSYNAHSGMSEKLGIPPPKLNEDTKTRSIDLVDGVNVGSVRWSAPHADFEQQDISKHYNKVLAIFGDHIKGRNKLIDEVINQGRSFEEVVNMHSSGPWAPAALEWFSKSAKRMEMTEDQLKKLLEAKVEIFKEVYIPYKVTGASYPTVSYVLYMPKDDLDKYIGALKVIVDAGGESNLSTKKEKIFKGFVDLIKTMTGEEGISDEEASRYSSKDIMKLIAGLRDEGGMDSSIFEKEAFSIGGIKDNNTTNSVINGIISRIEKTHDKLKRIQGSGGNYEFSYTANNEVYFWITLEEAF